MQPNMILVLESSFSVGLMTPKASTEKTTDQYLRFE